MSENVEASTSCNHKDLQGLYGDNFIFHIYNIVHDLMTLPIFVGENYETALFYFQSFS
jgi:hypothetical protein